MVLSVHLQCSEATASVICPLHGQFIVFLSLRPVALQSICLFQESLSRAASLAGLCSSVVTRLLLPFPMR